jgi:hypothetical protein
MRQRTGSDPTNKRSLLLPEVCGSASTDYNFSVPTADGLEPTYHVPVSDYGWTFAGAITDVTNLAPQLSNYLSLAFFFGSFKTNVI